MKKYILLLLPILSFAFSLSVNSGMEDGKAYSVLHLRNESEFFCKEEILAYDKKLYVCEIAANTLPKIDDKILSLVEIRFREEGEKLRIYITPRSNSRLISQKEPLFTSPVVLPNGRNFSKHHSILIDPNISEFDKQSRGGLNFAPIFNDMQMPSVGALDLNKAPIESAQSNDINLYLEIKKSYEKKQYEDVIAASQTALKRYEKSIFASEFLLYRLRALDKIFDTQDSFDGVLPSDVSAEGRAWMRRFVSDENYPEVLYLVTKSYLKQDMTSDANYTLDILMNEHPGSNFTKLAILEFADRIYDAGRQDDAIKMYEDVLYSATALDVASRAALSLVRSNIEKSKFDNAKIYMLKILNANQTYLLNDTSKLFALANVFSEKKMDDVASLIYEILVKNLKKTDDNYELALKNLGMSLMDVDTNKAYEYLKKYQNEFKDGEYESIVQSGLDRLFFSQKETNATKLHEHYDMLMSKYDKGEIGAKALKEQVALYLKERKFRDVLRYTEAVKSTADAQNLQNLNLAALNLAEEFFRQDDCKAVINLVENYEIKDEIKAKFKLFNCYMRLSRFAPAFELAKANITAPDMLDRVEWLVNLSSVLNKMQRYAEALRVADEALAIASRQEYADVSPVLFDRFEALINLKRIPDAIATINAIELLREHDFKIIELYEKMASVAFGEGDFLNAATYAKKTIDLQKRLHIGTFTPQIEFLYVGALSRLDRLTDALEVAQELTQLRLAPSNRVRALAQISELYIKLKRTDDAKPYLEECVGINLQSSWKALCNEQMKLVE